MTFPKASKLSKRGFLKVKTFEFKKRAARSIFCSEPRLNFATHVVINVKKQPIIDL